MNKKYFKQILVASMILNLVLLSVVFSDSAVFQQEISGRQETKVTRVIDGDTVVISSGERVRLLGIDTPELEEKCFKEARDKLVNLVENKIVILESDTKNKDRYGRLLRWIFIDDQNVNLEILKAGLAEIMIFEEVKYLEDVYSAFDSAKEGKIGCLWNDSD